MVSKAEVFYPISPDTKELPGKGIPEHVAIIPDRNRTWAREHKLSVANGYKKGAQRIVETADVARELGIPYLTFWLLSPTNLEERDSQDIDDVFDAIQGVLIDTALPKFAAEGVNVKVIGRMNREMLPSGIVEGFTTLEDRSRRNSGMNLTFAVNYDTDTEIDDAIIHARMIGEEIASSGDLKRHLSTTRAGLPNPDWTIRTGGEEQQRMNGFMQLQSQGSKFDFPDVLWPDFGAEEFRASVKRFASRTQALGG